MRLRTPEGMPRMDDGKGINCVQSRHLTPLYYPHPVTPFMRMPPFPPYLTYVPQGTLFLSLYATPVQIVLSSFVNSMTTAWINLNHKSQYISWGKKNLNHGVC